jgi:hypothetical protein
MKMCAYMCTEFWNILKSMNISAKGMSRINQNLWSSTVMPCNLVDRSCCLYLQGISELIYVPM